MQVIMNWMKRKCAWRRGALRYSRVQQRANAIVPTRFHRPAKPLQTQAARDRQEKKHRIKKLCVAGVRFVTRVKKQLSLTPTSSVASPSSRSKTFAENASRVMLNESHSNAECCCWCSLPAAGLFQHFTHSHNRLTLTRKLYVQSLHQCIERQIVTRVHTHIETKKNPHQMADVPYSQPVPTQHHSIRTVCLQTVFTLVLLLLYCVRQICYDYKFFVLLNLKFSWYSTNVRFASTPIDCLKFSVFFPQFFAASDGLCLSIDKLSRLLSIKFGTIAEN